MSKLPFTIASVACLLAPVIHAELAPPSLAPPSLEEKTTRSYIPNALDVPEFVPPVQAEPKRVPAIRIDSSITVPTKDSRTLTLIRGEASTLPDIPATLKAIPQEHRPFAPEELARIAFQRRHTLQIGGIAFDNKQSLVTWQHPDNGEAYGAICGFDIGLLAGVRDFVSNGETYTLMFHCLKHRTDRIRNFPANMLPELVEVPAGSIIITRGNPEDSTGIAPITLLKDLISSERSRLITYQENLVRYQRAAKEWEKAHPPAPRDETYWLRPHRGSRYLTNPTPEKETTR
jgi:hypothetical protein